MMNENLRGREYWLSLEHLANEPEFQAKFEQEFSGYDPEQISSLTRRSFMKIMGAAMGLAGLTLTGCRRWPEQQITPHAYQPEGFKPGVPVNYATMMELSGVATGLIVKSYDGRPIKIEGNPLHPGSLGAAGVFAQSSVLDVYDPDRSRSVIQNVGGKATQSSWDKFVAASKPLFDELRKTGGAGLTVLAEPSSSPTQARLRAEFAKAFPKATWATYEPLARDNEVEGTRQAFGKALRPILNLDKASIIASFDADLLGLHPNSTRHARDWAKGRLSADQGVMNRLYVIESPMTLTGAAADHRLPVRPSLVRAYLYEVAAGLGLSVPAATGIDAKHKLVLAALIADLKAANGKSIVTVGASQPADLHALAWAINDALGNLGKTVTFIDEPQSDSSAAAIAEVSAAANAGQIDTIVILGGNPVFDAPADLNFAAGLKKVKNSIHLSSDYNETSKEVSWHLPRAHALESWGDGRAWDGSISVQQPLILPIFGGKSSIEVLALVLGLSSTAGMDLVKETILPQLATLGSEQAWKQTLHDGVLKGSAAATVDAGKASLPKLAEVTKLGDMEVRFAADYALYDGRFANNGWLQEMPDPVTKITWDNVAQISKTDADRLKIRNGDLVKVEVNGKSIEIAAYIQPGSAIGTVVLSLGYGRNETGAVGKNVGFNTYALRTTKALWSGAAATVSVTGKTYKIATTQDHYLIDAIGVYGRDKRVGKQGETGYLVREATLEEYKADVHAPHRSAHSIPLVQLFDKPNSFTDPHAWGMTIDMNSCIGCNACMIACQAENNVPIVGKENVANNREMHWLRIDRYYKGDVENPDTVYTPMACTHCENAPCEQVCPVAATVHDTEGLNTMVYNRCIGTRYCSNNCPVKVRRFNYFDYHAKDPRGAALPWLGIPDTQQQTIDKVKQMVFNPDVTVRMRGVMEKCTYCVQRIQSAKISAKIAVANGERKSEIVQEGEVVTACQSTCPTQAITFGNLNDRSSKVALKQANYRAYSILEELNIQPRTKYLAKLRNPAVEAPRAEVNEHA